MKKANIIILLTSLLFIGFTACKKDNNPPTERLIINKEKEKVTATTTSVSITGEYIYDGKVKRMILQLGAEEHLFGSNEFEAVLHDKAYSVTASDLTPGTLYYYRYIVDYGDDIDFESDIYQFTTQSEAPTVRTLEVLATDSTSVRVKCEVLSGGGLEVTERGICYNTYGDPTLDDDTLQYTSGGPGLYTIRMENLTANTRYYVRAYAKNGTGIGFGEVLEFKTGGETSKPQVSTVEVNEVTYNAATCLCNVSSDGGLELTERGVCWGLEPDPTVNVHKVTAQGTETGNYTVTIEGLNPNTDYHVRAYAINEKGIAYGEDLPFTTTDGKPTVTTSAVTDITATSATGGGTVTNEGASQVTERGICWSTSHEPTTSGSHAQNGTGAGNYTCDMTALVPNETYYVRAYATNNQGTAYGAEVEFTAREGMPIVVTLDVTDITATSAKAHGKVTDQGGSTVTERGICWGTEPSPTISGSHAHSGTGIGEYTVEMTDLVPGTKYYVRAYAINAQGMTYGEQKDFTTAATLPTLTMGSIDGTTVHYTVTGTGGAPVTEHGICWSTSHSPTTSDSNASGGTSTGSFEVAMTDLEPGTTYYVRAYATNNVGTAYSSELSFTTQANLPTVTTGEVTNIGQTTAQGSGNVTNDGGAEVTERGVCWNTSQNPTISGSHASSGTGTGSYTVNMTGLTANTHYYVRAYAKNSAGVSYGNEVDFTTAQNVSAPTVTTSQVTNVTQTTATGGGNVTSTGGANVTERGICWSTSHNPTTSGSHANSGTGTGSFTVNMTGLTANTTYYVRAYAINSAGTSYGSEVSFTTQQAITVPTVTTSQVTNIQQTSATGGGNVTNNGGANVTERGICWGTSHNPTTSGSHAYNGMGTGTFTVNMTGLTANTTYYVRAYATNSAGTAYGSEVSFSTSQIPSYTISVSASPSSGGTVSGGGTYQQGQSCTVHAAANSGYTFTNWTEGGSQVSTNANYTFTVTGNRTLVAHFTYNGGGGNAPTGAINGLFTINANGDQVFFSQGNLQYQASTNTWRFATNQYDYIGDANSYISPTYSGWIDLFGWGTSGYNHGAVCYQPWSTSSTDSDYYAYGQSTYNLYDQTGQADWGYNAISNGGNTTNTWRTLTGGYNSEWRYIFETRSTPSGIRYAKARVNGVNGVILLPDDWSASYYSLSNTNQGTASYSSNVISSTQWSTLEQHGAVFLPAAGFRDGTSVNLVGSDSGYWSASYSNSNCAYGVYFNDSNLYPVGGNYRYYGRSVRLVRSAQ